jgi:hypothetical protein
MLGALSAEAAPAAPSAPPVAPEERREEEESPVRLRFVLPLWLPLLDMQSSATSEGTETEIVETESEVTWVLTGMLEAGYRPIVVRIDLFGIGFGDQILRENGEPTDIVIESSGFVGRAVLMYELGPWRFSRNDARKRFLLAPLAGARYNRLAFETGEQTEISGVYDWVDPLVGARTEFFLGDWRIGTHIDVGGFGVSSELAFWAAVNIEYMITSWFSLWIGWQHYQVLFKAESNQGEERLELFLTGPSAGLGLHVF